MGGQSFLKVFILPNSPSGVARRHSGRLAIDPDFRLKSAHALQISQADDLTELD
jgi:hypothetical protein